jgi:hypothetical protein
MWEGRKARVRNLRTMTVKGCIANKKTEEDS